MQLTLFRSWKRAARPAACLACVLSLGAGACKDEPAVTPSQPAAPKAAAVTPAPTTAPALASAPGATLSANAALPPNGTTPPTNGSLRTANSGASRPTGASTSATSAPVRLGEWDVSTLGQADDLRDVAFMDLLAGVVVGRNNTLLLTLDGGRTWVRTATRDIRGPHFSDVVFTNLVEGYALAEGGDVPFRTIDGGESWQPLPTPPSTAPPFAHSVADDTYLLKAGDTIYRLSDDLADWTRVMTLPNRQYTGFAVPFSRHAIAVGGSAVPHVAMSGDSGSTWIKERIPQLQGTRVRIVCADMNTAWIMGERGPLYATTNGRTWTVQRPGHGDDDEMIDILFKDSRCGLLLTGRDGQFTVRRTSDGGQTWSALPVLRTTARMRALATRGPEEIIVVGEGGTIARLAVKDLD